MCAHNHACGNINNDNDDKTRDAEILVKSENATENSVEVEELFEDDKSWQPEPIDAQKELEDIDNKFDKARVAKLKCSQ